MFFFKQTIAQLIYYWEELACFCFRQLTKTTNEPFSDAVSKRLVAADVHSSN